MPSSEEVGPGDRRERGQQHADRALRGAHGRALRLALRHADVAELAALRHGLPDAERLPGLAGDAARQHELAARGHVGDDLRALL